MTKTREQTKKLPWKTPQLRRISAGSAEAQKPAGTADAGGPGANDFS
jgi:hypothetical protein